METVILFAPLVGAIIAGFGHRIIGDKAAQVVTTAMLFLAMALSWIVFLGHDGQMQQIEILRFIQSGDLNTSWGIRLDRLTTIMLVVITSVSALVHFYSIGYMAHDENFSEEESYRPRFFAYLSFFTFAMLTLVTSDNLVQMFFGWEGVGVASYLLIGFYFRKDSANAASIKAFVVNRVGDFGFALGIFGLFMMTGSIQFNDIFAAAPELAETTLTFLWRDWNAANLLAFLLFVGAMGKSAQLFLHTWLPDAMEGPTPVSALIHAATMVTAGVFLVARMSPLMEFAPDTMAFVTFLGATTAFVAASIGLVQNDIKRVIAYSTMSQLGYMFVAAGVGVYSVAMFHLFTHAFFKAMLFLGAGSVIHGMHHEQDMRNYGGLRKKLPMTFWAMMIGTLAITGVGIPLWTISGMPIGFAGFVSKDAIIESAYVGTMGGYGFWMLVIAALFTSFYSWRLMFLTFYGEARGDKHTHDHAHESPMIMLVPLGVLAIGSITAGMIWYGSFFGKQNEVIKYFGGHYTAPAEELAKEVAANNPKASKLKYVMEDAPGEAAIYIKPENTVLHEAHYVPTWVKLSPFVAMVIGFLTALWFYIWNPSIPGRLAANQRPLYLFLLNKWYFDEIYDFLFVKPASMIGRFLWKRGDGSTIDGMLNGLAMGIIPFFTRLAGKAQSGYLFTYAFAMVIGIVALITWMTLAGGAR
ncbi:MAG: NADH-quinone oxidoreductase subunit L [Paracoccaceae bacterium]|jgi:NADH-quinone oxidoreductase subunit L|nr:NADH-quinone oxidoreductase subunit L [Paracoccaceae bacterium]